MKFKVYALTNNNGEASLLASFNSSEDAEAWCEQRRTAFGPAIEMFVVSGEILSRRKGLSSK